MSAKSIVIGLVITAVAGYFLLKERAKKLTSQFSNIKIIPVGFKNLDGRWNNEKPFISFNIDLQFINPTFNNFEADGVVVTLKKLLFYDKNNKLIGSSNINLSALKIPANSSTIVPNVPIVLDVQTTLINIFNMINAGSFNTKNITTSAIIEVLGVEYKI